mgnify:CR=1 FL=1
MVRILILMIGVFSTGFACGGAFLMYSLKTTEVATEVMIEPVEEQKIFLQSEKMSLIQPAPACVGYDKALSFAQNLDNCSWTERRLLDI